MSGRLQFSFRRPRVNVEGWHGFGFVRHDPPWYGGMDWTLHLGFVTVRHWRR